MRQLPLVPKRDQRAARAVSSLPSQQADVWPEAASGPGLAKGPVVGGRHSGGPLSPKNRTLAYRQIHELSAQNLASSNLAQFLAGSLGQLPHVR